MVSAQTFTTQKWNIGGDGFFDYLSTDPGTGHVFVSRATHIIVVDGATGRVVGDIPNTPRVHGAAIAAPDDHGFTTNGGDSTSTMFDLKTLAVIKKIPAGIDGLDGFFYDDAIDKVLTMDHSQPVGTSVVIDAKTGDVVGRVTLTGNGPEGAAGDNKGRIFVNLEDKNAIDVIDSKTWKVVSTWPVTPCDGPAGLAMDRTTNRLFVSCSKTSVVVDAANGKVVAQIPNGDGVDAIGWDQSQKLIYIPAGRDGNVTVVHEDSPDKYTVVEKVPMGGGARTCAVDELTHKVYVFYYEGNPRQGGKLIAAVLAR